MKKTLTSVVMIAAGLLAAASAAHADILYAVDFSTTDGYSTGAIAGQNGWTSPDTSGTVVSTPASPTGSDHVFSLVGAASSATTIRNELVFTDTPLTTPFTVDIWMMRSIGSSLRDSYVNLTSQSSLGNGLMVGFDDDKFFYQKIGNDNYLTSESYVANTWYRFHLEVDPSASGYSLTIYNEEGETIVSTLTGLEFRGGTFVNSVDVLRASQLGGSNNTSLYIGAVTFSNNIPEPASFAAGMIGLIAFAIACRRLGKRNR